MHSLLNYYIFYWDYLLIFLLINIIMYDIHILPKLSIVCFKINSQMLYIDESKALKTYIFPFSSIILIYWTTFDIIVFSIKFNTFIFLLYIFFSLKTNYLTKIISIIKLLIYLHLYFELYLLNGMLNKNLYLKFLSLASFQLPKLLIICYCHFLYIIQKTVTIK
jgi:hypothetical protein